MPRVTHDAARREYKLNFLTDAAEAKIVLGMFPADRKAVEHFNNQRGVLGPPTIRDPKSVITVHSFDSIQKICTPMAIKYLFY